MNKSQEAKKETQINIADILSKAVRTVGTFKPKFNPKDGKVFSDELEVKGTAFWLKDYGVLVTCAHVVQEILSMPLELAGLLVVGNHGAHQRAIMSHIDYQHDLAVLTLVDANTGQIIDNSLLQTEINNGLSVSESYSQVGSEVAWSGYPHGVQLLNQKHDPTYSVGVVGVEMRDNKTKKEIQISGVVVGGYSGSPVVNKADGKVVGVVANGPQNSGIFMAVSWEHVLALAKLARS